MNPKPLPNLALVTGASCGLGKALAQALAAKRIPLILAARDEQRLHALAAELDVPVQVYAVDLTHPQEREQFLAYIAMQTPDLIINNAGMGAYGIALSHSTPAQSKLVELNIQALIEITLEAARSLLRAHKEGTIMNISSAAAFFPYPTHCIYAATKACVNQFSEGLDYELKPQGIRVLASCPGQINTEFSFRASCHSKNARGMRKRRKFLSIPVQKAAQLILKQIETGKGIQIIDWRYKCLVALRHLLPQSVIMHYLNRSLER